MKSPTVQHDPHADEYTKAYRAGQQAMLDEMTGLLNAATAERDALAAQLDGAMQEASSLAMSIWKSEFSKEAPEFELCDSARGVVTQIDNMFAGIRNQRDELAAQVAYLTELVKVEAYEAYWEASDSNRADRWADTFDESVEREFEKYWATNKLDSKLIKPPQHHLRQVRADAGRAGFIAGYFHYKNYGFQFEEELEAASNQFHASIRQDGK